MRIACLVGKFPLLSQTFVLNQITGLLARGHEVDIFPAEKGEQTLVHAHMNSYNLLDRTFYPPQVSSNLTRRRLQIGGLMLKKGWRLPGVANIFCFDPRPARTTRSLLFLSAVASARRQPYDVIHGHFGPQGLRGMALRQIGALRGPMVTTFYGHDVSSYPLLTQSDVYEPLFASCERLLVLSELMKRELIELGCDRDKIAIHHVGTDCNVVEFQPRITRPQEAIRLLSIARFVEKKGLRFAVQAFAKLANRYPNLRYDIIGDGPLRGEIERLIDESDLSKRIVIHGMQDQEFCVQKQREAHIFVAPSITAPDGEREGTPTVLIEAMAVGMPIVSTRHSGIPEVVQDGISGWLVPEADADALAETIDQLINSPHSWPQMGRAGRAWVEQHFDINGLNDRLVEIYEQVRATA